MVSVCLEEQIRLTCLQSDDVRIILRPGKKKTAFTQMFQGGYSSPEPLQPERDPQEEVL